MDKSTPKEGGAGAGIFRRLASFEALFLLFTLLAVLSLRPPLLERLASLPTVAAVAPALVLLAAPGVALGGLLAGRAGWTLRAALATPLGIAAYGLPALAALTLEASFAAYLAAARWVVVLSLVLLLYLIIRRLVAGPPPAERARTSRGRWDVLLWLPFAGLTGVLAAVSAATVHEPNTDTWTYLRFVEEFSGSAALNASTDGFSRTTLGGWFLIQAVLSEVSGVQPVTLTLDYLAPFLVVAAVFAFYGTARVLFEDGSAALLAGILYALFLLVSLDGTIFSAGGEFAGRIIEDKFVARFLFLPPALAAAVLFVRERRLGYLALFGVLCAGVLSVHPIGLVIIGIPVAGFGLLHLILNFRRLEAWLTVFGLWVSGLVIVLPLGGYLLVTDSRFLDRLVNTDPALAGFRVRVWEYGERLLALGDGSYIMHPALLLEPLVLAGYVAGLPVLIWWSWRNVAARLLLGTLLLTPAVLYIPPVASFIGEVIGPWTLWRLAWPVPLAAALSVAWVLWEALAYVRRRLLESRMAAAANPVRFAATLLPSVAVIVLVAVALPVVSTGVRAVETPSEVAWDETSCSDPVFSLLQRSGVSGGIMAQDRENSCIAAYSDELRVLSYRTEALNAQASLGRQDIDGSGGGGVVGNFFGSPVVTRPMVQSLKGHKVNYVLLPVNSPLNPQLSALGGVTPVDTPGNRYQLYEVDREELEVTAVVQANTYLQNGNAARAATVYQRVLDSAPGDASTRLAALTGLAQAYTELQRPDQAAATYKEALALDPEQPALYYLAADAYAAASDLPAARDAMNAAKSRFPENAALREKLASALAFSEPQRAIAEQRAVVETYPEVPDYHLRLGSLLNLSAGAGTGADDGASEDQGRRAEEQFGRAVYLQPRSADLHSQVGNYQRLAGHFEKSAAAYERAVEIDPENPFYRFKLGEVYSTLSLKDPSANGSGEAGDDREGYYEEARDQLRRAAETEPLPWQDGLSARAWVALGDLYAGWDEREKAREAYEKALEAAPDSALAQERVENFR